MTSLVVQLLQRCVYGLWAYNLNKFCITFSYKIVEAAMPMNLHENLSCTAVPHGKGDIGSLRAP